MDKSSNAIVNLYDLLKNFDTAMMMVRTSDGHVQGRPMAVALMQENADDYFMTSIHSPNITAIQTDPSMTLTFQNSNQFASLSGQATIVRDRPMIDNLWK
ncbi:MAG: pyridoxamine 5'-phosphate oxidase family protein [Polaromonas sp.]|nr:pyridoxamine 5'-phosphate oxidase family protein [Polaromonas sp.]